MRQRKNNAKRGGQGGEPSGAAATGKPGDLLFGMAVSALVLLAVLGVVTVVRRPAASGSAGAGGGRRVFTADELAAEGGGSSKTLLLAILGEVYDVSAGAEYYAEGSGYHCFAGRDGSRAFVTGEFEGAGVTDDVDGLSPGELDGVLGWRDFYRKEGKYPAVGVLSGRYYDEAGERRPGVLDELERTVVEWKEAEAATTAQFPPCNSKWTADASEVWCTSMSGGTERGWVGYPRKMHKRGSSPDESTCVCTEDANTFVSGDNLLEVYDGCDKLSARCAT